METKTIFIASETKHNELKVIPLGAEIFESPIGPGVFNGTTEVGYPKVNGIAVTCFITKDGFIYQSFDNHLRLLNNQDNKTSLFYYKHENVWIKEGEGIYPDAYYGKPYKDDLMWKIEIYDEDEINNPVNLTIKVPVVESANNHIKSTDKELDEMIDSMSKRHQEQQQKDENYAQELVDTLSPSLLVSENIDETVLNHKTMLKSWIKDFMRESRNTQFYQNIVTEIGELFGDVAKTSDDGSLQDSVLALKVPELVKQLIAENKTLKEKLQNENV